MSPFRGSVPFTDEWEHFRLERADGVTTVTFDRPDNLNALTFEAYADLRDLLTELPHRGDTRVLVLRGRAGRSARAATSTRSSARRCGCVRTSCWSSPG